MTWITKSPKICWTNWGFWSIFLEWVVFTLQLKGFSKVLLPFLSGVALSSLNSHIQSSKHYWYNTGFCLLNATRPRFKTHTLNWTVQKKDWKSGHLSVQLRLCCFVSLQLFKYAIPSLATNTKQKTVKSLPTSWYISPDATSNPDYSKPQTSVHALQMLKHTNKMNRY